MKMNFEYFQIQKWTFQTVIAKKVDIKNGVICLVSVFPFWVMVFKLSKKVHFWQICAELCKKPKSVEAIYIYIDLKVLITLFQKMIWFIEVWATVYDILAIRISKMMLTQQKFNNVLQIQTQTSEAISHSVINNTIFWKCVTIPFWCIHVNCFNYFNRFFVEVSIKSQKRNLSQKCKIMAI